MKIKFLLPGLLALVVTGAPLLTSLAVSAQQSPPATMQKKPTMAERLNLTDQQKADIQKIRQETAKRIDEFLKKTGKKNQYLQARKTMKPVAALKSLNLSTKQQTELKGILDKAKERISKVLTPQQLETLKKSHGQGRPDAL